MTGQDKTKRGVGSRVALLEDGWCGSPEFFVRLAIFEVTGDDDILLTDRGAGMHHNKTDGAYHHQFSACRAVESSGTRITRATIIPLFDVYGNIYSSLSIFEGAVAGIQKAGGARNVSVAKHNCHDERALPQILFGGGEDE